ncbi:sigma-70 family RNA polymerase sigma factor [Thermodesulfovibrio hydrogeniphilus]
MNYTEQEKEAIIQQFLPKIKHYALRYHYCVQNLLEVQDLISAGIKGLLEGLNRYNPSLNVPLASFIDYRIRGAILDEIRSCDVFSKEFRKKIEDVKKAYTELKNKGDEPTDEEIASHLNITSEELQNVYQSIRASDIISLDENIEGENGDKLNLLNVISEQTNVFDEITFKELKDRLAKAIEQLPQQEKLLISLYYFEELNMKEIAQILGVSVSRVSQLHGKILVKLKNLLDKS